MKIKSNNLNISGLELRKLTRSNLYHHTIYSTTQEDHAIPPETLGFSVKKYKGLWLMMDNRSRRIANGPCRTERLAMEGLNQIDMDEYRLALMINKTL